MVEAGMLLYEGGNIWKFHKKWYRWRWLLHISRSPTTFLPALPALPPFHPPIPPPFPLFLRPLLRPLAILVDLVQLWNDSVQKLYRHGSYTTRMTTTLQSFATAEQVQVAWPDGSGPRPTAGLGLHVEHTTFYWWYMNFLPLYTTSASTHGT